MNLIRVAWAIVALGFIVLVTCAPFIADSDAATIEDVNSLMGAFSTVKVRVIGVRKIRFWDAQANTVAHCYTLSVPDVVPTPPKGHGFYAHQWMLSTTSTIVTEEQCYSQ